MKWSYLWYECMGWICGALYTHGLMIVNSNVQRGKSNTVAGPNHNLNSLAQKTTPRHSLTQRVQKFYVQNMHTFSTHI